MPTPAEKIAKVIHRSMVRQAGEVAGVTDKVAVSLSGGVDSCGVLAAFLEVGLRPTCYSYTPSTHESTDFKMARQTAENMDLEFHGVIVQMEPRNLESQARYVMKHGARTKVQVESLVPIANVVALAGKLGLDVFATGDQSDGYFSLSRSANFVRYDETSERIDNNRRDYYKKDKSCSGLIDDLCKLRGMDGLFPFRHPTIYKAFLGNTWQEVNKPRLKEPVKLAFGDWFQPDKILTRTHQVNLHKGDSRFGDTFAEILMDHIPGDWRSPAGLYGAMRRGEA